jgi:hypothetical protein
MTLQRRLERLEAQQGATGDRLGWVRLDGEDTEADKRKLEAARANLADDGILFIFRRVEGVDNEMEATE